MSHGNRILIVEDEAIFAKNLGAHLRKAAHEVRIASDGYQAIETAAKFAPQVVVVDYKLPGIDGLQTIELIRRRHGICGCVLMSGDLSEAAWREVRRQGIRHVLVKPFALARLDRVLGLPPEEIALAPHEPLRSSRRPAGR